MSNQTQQPPGWGPPTTPQPPKPPKQKRQFTVTKIAIGVAAGIALFLVGVFVLIAVAIGGGNTTASRVSGTTPVATEGPTSPSLSTDTPASNPADETPTPAVGQVGDTVTATGSDGGSADITVTKIGVSFATIDYQTAEHGMFLVVHVKAKGTGGSFDINPFDFYVTGSDGTHYEDSTYLDTGAESALESGTLHDSEHVSGVLVYDVNTKARHGKFVYSPNLDSEPIATWTF